MDGDTMKNKVPENFRELLNGLYEPLNGRADELKVMLSGMCGCKMTDGFYNGHCHKSDSGEYVADAYPIRVISVPGLCDIEVDFDSIAITAKLAKETAAEFDWQLFKNAHFEVYGVEDYLQDYGNSENIAAINGSISACTEKELFVTFCLPAGTAAADVLRIVQKLRECGFYY